MLFFISLWLAVAAAATPMPSTENVCTHHGGKTKVTVTTTNIDSRLYHIDWVGPENKVGFVTTTHDLLYRTSDDGKTWTDEETKLDGFSTPRGSLRPPRHGIFNLIASAKPELILFVGYGNAIWVTEDAGETYKLHELSVDADEEIASVAPHPTDETLFVVETMRSVCLNTTLDGACYYALYVARFDGGAFTTKRLSHYVEPVNSQWLPSELLPSELASDADGGAQREGVAFLAWDDKSGHHDDHDPADLILYAAAVDVSGSVSMAPEPVPLATSCVDFVVRADLSLLLAVRQLGVDRRRLFVRSSGTRSEWRQAQFTGMYREEAYSVIDVGAHAVLVSVRETYYAAWGHTYGASGYDEQFTRLLDYNAYEGGVELQPVRAIDGLLFANVKRYPLDDDDYTVATRVSYSLGGEWQAIKLENVRDETGAPMTCAAAAASPGAACALHLALASKRASSSQRSWLAPFVHAPWAPGVIVATGLVGVFLDMTTEAGLLDTWISRDAGLRWQRLAKGTHSLDVAHGGDAILWADYAAPNNTLFYSFDEGASGSDGGACAMTPSADDVVQTQNVFYLPTPTTTKPTAAFLVATRASSWFKQGGALVHVEMALHGGVECTDDAKQLERWSPSAKTSDSTETACVMGCRRVYVRRVPAARCVTPAALAPVDADGRAEPPPCRKCACTVDDYECDACFVLDPATGQCRYHPSAGGAFSLGVCGAIHNAPDDCQGTYDVPSGYRRVPGSQCTGKVVAYEPTPTPCPAKQVGGDGGGGGGANAAATVIVVLLILALVGGAIGAGVAYRVNDRFKRWVNVVLLKRNAATGGVGGGNVGDALDDGLLDESESDEAV